MQKLVFTNGNGISVDLTAGNFGITNWEGFSNTSLNIQTQQVPFKDGGVFLDALLEQREISVTVAIQDNNDLVLRYQKKRELISVLNPKLGEGTLTYSNNYLSKQIKAIPQIPLFENKNSNDAGTLKASVSFSCCNPYWEDIVPNSKPLSVGVIEPVFNEGDVPTEMEIDFFISNTKNPKIENLTTGKAIKLNGTFTDNIRININMGKKTVNYNRMVFDYSNILNTVGYSSPNATMKVFYSNAFNLYIAFTRTYSSTSGYDTVFVSNDFIHWKILSELYQAGVLDVYMNDTMIYIYGYGTAFKTTDGKTWNEITISAPIIKLVYSKTLNRYFAIGFEDFYYRIYSSTDLINFEQVYIAPSMGYHFSDICCSDSMICVAGYYQNQPDMYGVLLTSPNGSSWTIIEKNKFYNAITYAKEINLFCAVGVDGYISSSSDGITWNDVTLDSNNDLFSVGFLSGVRTLYASNKNLLYKSLNGITWEAINLGLESVGIVGLISIADYGLYIPVGAKLLKTIDGNNFTNAMNTISINRVAYSEKLGVYCAISSSIEISETQVVGFIYYSYDCINWSVAYSLISGYWWSGFTDICYCEKIGKFIACEGGTILCSEDGIHWIEEDVSIPFQGLSKLVVSEKLGMIIGLVDGDMIRTEDGINWSSIGVSSPSDMCFSEKIGLFCGVTGQTYKISSDGVNWTTYEQTELGSYLICKSENLGIFFAVGEKIITSTDGLNWSVTATISRNVNSITYSEELGLFCLVGEGGYISISPDAINWVNKTQESVYFFYVTYVKKLDAFLIGSELGTIITSIESVENIISTLDTNSDMSLSLVVGKNDLLLTQESGGLSGRITYRQKYLGV